LFFEQQLEIIEKHTGYIQEKRLIRNQKNIKKIMKYRKTKELKGNCSMVKGNEKKNAFNSTIVLLWSSKL
jgi:hypothetical protein